MTITRKGNPVCCGCHAGPETKLKESLCSLSPPYQTDIKERHPSAAVIEMDLGAGGGYTKLPLSIFYDTPHQMWYKSENLPVFVFSCCRK